MLVSWKLKYNHFLFLPVHPLPTLQGTLQVYRTVPIAVKDLGFFVRKTLIMEGIGCFHTGAIKTVYAHPRWCHLVEQGLSVLSHEPAILKIDVPVELPVVPKSVVGRGCAHKDLVWRPRVVVGEQPVRGNRWSLLVSDLEWADHRYSIVVTLKNVDFHYPQSKHES